MAYSDQTTPRDRATSIAAVVAVHAAIGYALVVGLQAVGFIDETQNPQGHHVPQIPIEPPPPPPEPPKAEPQAPTTPQVHMPTPTVVLQSDPPIIDDIVVELPQTDFTVPKVVPSGSATGAASDNLAAIADPVAAKPRNDPGSWITDNDYRTSWINRDMEGIAGFAVTVGTNGRVESCTITQSTGHSALDAATCRLIGQRARFEPARNAQGERVPGTFANKVRWRIPD